MEKTLRMLVVGDSDGAALLLVRHLPGFEITWKLAQTADELRTALQSEWDVILFHDTTQAFDAHAALQITQGSSQDIPFIIISSSSGEEAAVAAMRAGACDYLMKDNLGRLGEAVRRELADASLRKEQRQQHARTKHLQRVLLAIRHIHKIILLEKSPQRLIDRACHSLVEARGYRGAWIAILDAKANPTLAANTGFDTDAVDFTSMIGRGELPLCGTLTLASHENVRVNDPRATCSECPFRSGLSEYGSLTIRLASQGRVYGIMSVHLSEKTAIEEDETSLLSEIAEDIAFALHSLEVETQESRYARIVASSTEAMTLIDKNQVYLEANPAYLQMIGVDDTIVGQRVQEVIGQRRFRDMIEPHLRQCFGGKDVRVETDITAPDGTVHTLDADFSPCRGSDDEVTAAAVCIRDVTEQRRVEKALRLSEQRYASLVDNAPGWVWEIDADGICTYASPSIEKLLGYTPDEIIGKGPLDFMPPEQAKRLAPKYKELLRAKVPFTGLETRSRHRDGREVVFETTGVPIFDEVGELVGYRGMDHDITERKASEEALRVSEESLKTIFDESFEGILLADTETRNFCRANKTILAMLGYTEEELFQLGIQDIHPEEDVARVIQIFEKQARGELDVAEELPVKRKDGSVFFADISARRIVLEGKPYVAGVFRDVTERKQMQAHLVQSDRLASMGMLAAGVAHEVNNPLAYVLYNLESLKDDMPRVAAAIRKCKEIISQHLGDEHLAEMMGGELAHLTTSNLDGIWKRFSDAVDGSVRVRDVVRGLKSFSRVDKERREPVDLREVIETAIHMAFHEIKYAARLVRHYGEVSRVIASDGRLSQVFLNILVNAVHAIDQGHVESNEIRIRTWQERDEVLAEVSDTGKGIPEEHVSKLFDPFFTTTGSGTGLGLWISKNIIEDYGGRIEVESEEGKGTRFVIRLPASETNAPIVHPPARQAPVKSAERGRVLIVDDEPVIRLVMTHMLKGYDIVEASSGREAQEVLETDHGFDLILCDMVMPSMSGMDLYEWLSETAPELAERMVFVTGGAFTPRATEFLRKISNPKLEKPFDVGTFTKVVSEQIAAHRTTSRDGR